MDPTSAGWGFKGTLDEPQLRGRHTQQTLRELGRPQGTMVRVSVSGTQRWKARHRKQEQSPEWLNGIEKGSGSSAHQLETRIARCREDVQEVHAQGSWGAQSLKQQLLILA